MFRDNFAENSDILCSSSWKVIQILLGDKSRAKYGASELIPRHNNDAPERVSLEFVQCEWSPTILLYSYHTTSQKWMNSAPRKSLRKHPPKTYSSRPQSTHKRYSPELPTPITPQSPKQSPKTYPQNAS